MKLFFLALILLYNASCDKTGNELPEVEQSTKTEETANVDNESEPPTIPIQQTNNPGEITFKIKILDVYSSAKDICGVSRENVMQIEVVEILKRGMGITNMPHVKNELFIDFVLPPKDLEKNMIIEARAKESLCLETSKTYYTVNSYEILE